MSEPQSAPLTPVMQQYADLKAQAGDALLFFRMGDFYELFGQDAVDAARLLQITLTSRDKTKPDPVPMAGVPFHSITGYIQKLLKAGRKVAIGEQLDETAPSAKGAKAIVRREITRILTPAIQFEMEGAESHWLATAIPTLVGQTKRWRLAVLEPSTGDLELSHALDEATLLEECARLPIRHFLRIGNELPISVAKLSERFLIEDLPTHWISPESARALLQAQFNLATLEGFFPDLATVQAAGLLIHYLKRSQRTDALHHLKLPRPMQRSNALTFGLQAAEHLDLLPSAAMVPNLYDFLNRTRTAMGARRLRRWIQEPLTDPEKILLRQNALKELSSLELSAKTVSGLRTRLAEVYDLERLSGRISTGFAHPRDTRALGDSLTELHELANKTEHLKSPLLGEVHTALRTALSHLSEISQRIVRTQKAEAPLSTRDGGIFERGTNPELDRLIDLSEKGAEFLTELETRERARTGISSLKVRYNRVFGYYIEITTAHLKQVPADYERKQTMVGAERFFTQELKRFEEEILSASSKQKSLEADLFQKLLEDLKNLIPAVIDAAEQVAEIDVLLALSELEVASRWKFPTIDLSDELEIELGRHPLVDDSSRGSFVPNSIRLGTGEAARTLIITGPNMGGKSTVMRQTALTVILGQMGAPVPAERARWGVVDAVFTRIGAQDAISRGQSTFMVEMSELAQILSRATSRSLIILDEIGRGTSTFDGMSVAWASLEWIAHQISARTLFATHYHELTALEAKVPGVRNAHMAVEENRETQSIRFLYEMRTGAANQSFGVHVASMAGLPKGLIKRAWQILEQLESQSDAHANQNGNTLNQLSLFEWTAKTEPTTAELEAGAESERREQLHQELETIDPNEMTPIQALTFLIELKEKAQKASKVSS